MVGHGIVIFPPFLAFLVPVGFKIRFPLRPVGVIIYLVGGKVAVILLHFCFGGRTDMLPCTRQSFLTAFDGICGSFTDLSHMLDTVIRCLIYCLAVCPDNIVGGVIIAVQ